MAVKRVGDGARAEKGGVKKAAGHDALASRRTAGKPTAKVAVGRKMVVPGDGGSHGELVILTGMSGAGKASALKAFEDLGYTQSIICPSISSQGLRIWSASRRKSIVRRW